MNDELFVALQRIAPQHLISRCAGALAASENTLIQNRFISWFHNKYQPDMSEAEISDPFAYKSFNDFFTRPLKADARPLATQNNPKAMICPADGHISQFGKVRDGRIFQAKGQSYSVEELLADTKSQVAPIFSNGEFATIYLSPKDYHRVHMPIQGQLSQMTHVPGRLFSVNPVTTARLPRLFARNERVVCLFETEIGPFALVLVGAMIVASIETVWAGLVTPKSRRIQTTEYGSNLKLKAGEEMGRFLLGSTVILIAPEQTISWSENCAPNAPVKMGEEIGVLR